VTQGDAHIVPRLLAIVSVDVMKGQLPTWLFEIVLFGNKVGWCQHIDAAFADHIGYPSILRDAFVQARSACVRCITCQH
jgi:hypothetical protein